MNSTHYTASLQRQPIGSCANDVLAIIYRCPSDCKLRRTPILCENYLN